MEDVTTMDKMRQLLRLFLDATGKFHLIVSDPKQILRKRKIIINYNDLDRIHRGLESL